jgi:hypothetical protein
MFLVELGSGKDTVFPSAQALSAAIRRGDLDADTRIYHRSSCQWLPITVHPEFRRLLAERERRPARSRQQWTFMRDGEGVEEVSPPKPASTPAPELIAGDPPRSWRQAIGLTLRRLKYLTHPRTG